MNSTVDILRMTTLIESIVCATTVLSTLHVLILLFFKTQSYDIGNIVIPILEMRKLR